MRYIIALLVSLLIGHKIYADEFPWVQQIEVQDSVTWIRTNEGLYRIIFYSNNTVDWDKITEGSGKIFIDSRNNVWISNFGDNLQVFDNSLLVTHSSDTTKHVYNIFELENDIYIETSINDNKQFFKWSGYSWIFVPDKPVLSNTSRNHTYNMNMEQIDVNLPDSIRIEKYNYDKNGNLWVLSSRTKNYIYETDSKTSSYNTYQQKKRVKEIIEKGGTFYKFENGRISKKSNFPYYNISISAFAITVNEKIWIGGYSYVAFFNEKSWIEFSFLPKPVHLCGPDEEEYHEEDDGSLTGYINDPDGYTNVRNEMNSNSKIIAKVLEGVPFKYWINENSNWYEIMLISGTKGYIHKSGIKH